VITLQICLSFAFQERDDVRRRTRQERLNELRSGVTKSWVQLYRENPSADDIQVTRKVDKFGNREYSK
jgi:hypothetical protein